VRASVSAATAASASRPANVAVPGGSEYRTDSGAGLARLSRQAYHLSCGHCRFRWCVAVEES